MRNGAGGEGGGAVRGPLASRNINTHTTDIKLKKTKRNIQRIETSFLMNLDLDDDTHTHTRIYYRNSHVSDLNKQE